MSKRNFTTKHVKLLKIPGFLKIFVKIPGFFLNFPNSRFFPFFFAQIVKLQVFLGKVAALYDTEYLKKI